MNYAIIGMGFIFPRHVEAIEQTGGKVILTCDIDPEKGADFLDYKEMLKSEKIKEVDTVVICTPNHLHRQMSTDALVIGKQVLCEKPLVISDNFDGLEDVNVVLQLRYHEMLEEIRKELKEENNIELVMKVYRDERWWNSWRGDESKSGGILIGLGIHMIDALIYLLGDNYEILESHDSIKLCTGKIKFDKTLVNYHVEVLDNKEGQTRSLIVNGNTFELCNKDNLSFSGHHYRVYEEMLKGNGIKLNEAKKSIKLILSTK